MADFVKGVAIYRRISLDQDDREACANYIFFIFNVYIYIYISLYLDCLNVKTTAVKVEDIAL